MNWHDLLVYCHVARNTSIWQILSACLPICKSERHFQRWPGVLTSQLSSPKLLSSLRCIADFEQKSFPEFVPNLHQALKLCLNLPLKLVEILKRSWIRYFLFISQLQREKCPELLHKFAGFTCLCWFVFAWLHFFGPKSDHWLPLSLTN